MSVTEQPHLLLKSSNPEVWVDLFNKDGRLFMELKSISAGRSGQLCYWEDQPWNRFAAYKRIKLKRSSITFVAKELPPQGSIATFHCYNWSLSWGTGPWYQSIKIGLMGPFQLIGELIKWSRVGCSRSLRVKWSTSPSSDRVVINKPFPKGLERYVLYPDLRDQ